MKKTPRFSIEIEDRNPEAEKLTQLKSDLDSFKRYVSKVVRMGCSQLLAIEAGNDNGTSKDLEFFLNIEGEHKKYNKLSSYIKRINYAQLYISDSIVHNAKKDDKDQIKDVVECTLNDIYDRLLKAYLSNADDRDFNN